MKRTRILALLLAAAMVLGTTAFAAEYTVKSGDTLGKIAASQLGDASRWKEIYEANKDTVTDPNKIYVGQKLTLPGGEATQPSTGTQTPSTPSTPTTPTVPTGDTVEYETDIVIVGAGGAGLLAAYTASEGGAKVIVMEKAANALGSNFSRCGGPAGAETIVAQRQGVTTTNKEVFDHLYDYANTTVDAKLLWEVWNRAGVAINEMVGLGIPFRDVNADTYGVGFLARHSFGVGGANRVGPLTDAIEANGGQFLYSTPGEHILMEDGKAVGVWGTNADGETVLVRAKAVMICTGGFQGDTEMLHERFGDVNVISLGSNNPTGDGIRMVLEAGGQLDRNFGVLGDEFKGNNTKAVGNNDNLVFWLYGGLFVDRDGDRFINEKLIADFPLALGGEAILRQGKVYAVMDAAYYEACTTDGVGIINYLGDPADWASKVGLRAKTGLVNAPGQLQKAIDEGWAYKADTLAEAAAYFGLENLEKTVAEYNEMCANGVDPMFNKSANFLTPVDGGPYYVFEYEPAAWSTFGGVKTDSYLRAVGAGGDVIPGLYAGGCEVGSYYAVPYFDGPGSCVGIAVGSGVWAAENMLDYIGKLADEPTYKTGNYSASVNGFGGPVTVTLTVAADKIINVFVDGADETPTVGGAILGTLANRAKATGKVDTVAGATITSAAAQVAYAKALALATDVTPAKTPVKDGKYTETAIGHSITAPMSVDVTISGGKITAIEVGENDETADILVTVTAPGQLTDRIIEAQSLDVDAIGGATASSNAIIQAVAQAIEEAGGKRADWYGDVAKSNKTVKLEGYDVIVVGLGGSGMASYVSAAENGATVFGIETAAKIGGTSAQVSGPMAINPQTKMDAQNEGKKFLEEEDLIEDWLEYTRGDAKEEMVRLFVNESGETMDWLITEYDFTFGDIRAFFHPKMWAVWASYTGSKTDMMTNAVNKAKAMNEKNDYMLELTATDLIVENGEVKGVKATYYDGTVYEIYGKNVILATGGFLGNSEMTEKYLGGTFGAHAMTQNNGAGVNMGLSVGAALYNEDMPAMVHMCNVRNIIKTDELDANEKAALTALSMNTAAPIIGINGVSLNGTSNLAFDCWKGGDTFFTLYTQEQLDAIKANGLANPASAMRGQGGRLAPDTPVETMDKILTVGAKYRDVFKADSVEALAALIGVDAEALAEVADGMTGTLYAIAGAGYYYGTCGGLDIDENMNVLKTDGTAIANLYAVGQDSMGVLFSNQDAYVTYGGAAQGWVLTSGRLAGANAAANSK